MSDHELTELFEKARSLGAVTLESLPGGVVVANVPEGRALVSVKAFVDEYRERPERRVGSAKVTRLQSFVAHVKRFADEHSAIFAHDDPTAPALLAVLDYHEQGATGLPRWSKHQTFYPFPLAPEWSAWTQAKNLKQSAFAAFVENHITDVLEPVAVGESVSGFAKQLGIKLASPSELMALSRGLSVRVDARVTQAVNLSTGEGQLSYEESHRQSDGKPLTVPGGFAIAVPVFRGGALYQLPVRLRYRVQEGQVSWLVDVHRADVVFEHAFSEACDFAAAETGLPIYFGQPER